MGDGLDDLQLDEPAGEQARGPAGAAPGRPGAGQDDQAGLGVAVEHGEPTGAGLGLADQRGFEALLDEALADALDGADIDVEGQGDVGVAPGGSTVGGVGLQQDAGVGDPLGGGLAGGAEGRQE